MVFLLNVFLLFLATHVWETCRMPRPEADGMQRQEMSKPCLQAGATVLADF